MAKIRKIIRFGETETRVVEEEVTAPEKKPPRVYRLIQASEIGFTIALPITLGALFGYWLDNRFDSKPKFMLAFLLLGVLIGFANLILIVKEFSKK